MINAGPCRSTAAQVARAEGELHAARTGLFAAVTAVADEAGTTGAASLRTRALVRVAAHIMVNSTSQTTAGRVLLGLEGDTSMV